ncbi:BQ5605_C006g04114 [Microbotryum silenes-dioicae]|uniref:BQ5605_C006g04114 protein n=1 Tax=Microbotryum silenes-dioicae TaxID=796604 RepID=A0A2X0MA60_9BASI|nr:BQ5605_C006g04114 [Microbotryum silenes-dioicae]
MVGTIEGSLLLVLSQTTSRIQYSISAGSHVLRVSGLVSRLQSPVSAFGPCTRSRFSVWAPFASLVSRPFRARIRTPSRQAPARNRSTRRRANCNNTDSSTTSRRSEGQQRHRQREKLELERSGPVPHSSSPNPASTASTLTTILLPEELGHNNCGDSGKGSKMSLSIDHIHPSQRPKSTLSRWVSPHSHPIALRPLPGAYPQHDLGAMDLLCRKCSAFHWDFECLGGRDTPVFRACCNDGRVELPMIKARNFCPVLQELPKT